MNFTNILKSIALFSIPVVSLIGCVAGGDNPGIEYAPNMYISQAYEPYTQEKKFDYNPNGMTMRLPVFGTVAKGQQNYVYPYPNNGDGYEASSLFYSWVAPTEKNVAEGDVLYQRYCWQCHGKSGKNDGSIFKAGKIPGPSWSGFQDEYIKNLPEGKIYHSITHGKGLMGSHASMLSPDERWKVIHYVKKLSKGDDFIYANEEIKNTNVSSNLGSAQNEGGEGDSQKEGEDIVTASDRKANRRVEIIIH